MFIQALFVQVTELYPNVAKGGLQIGGIHGGELSVFNSPCNSFCQNTERIVMLDDCAATLLHELGHAYAYVYCPSEVANEILAWDTAKSLAIEVGYQWTVEDDERLIMALGSYGLTPDGIDIDPSLAFVWWIKGGIVRRNDTPNGYAKAQPIPYTLTDEGLIVNDFYGHPDIYALDDAGWRRACPIK